MINMNLAIIGFGTVGRSFAKVLLEKKQLLEKKYGFQPKITGIFEINGAFINENGLNLKEIINLKPTEFKNHKYWKPKIKAAELIPEFNADTFLELTDTNIQTGEPGLTHIRKALSSGKNVVTSNKGPLALAYTELTELAMINNVYLRFKATVGGAIPIFQMAEIGLMGNSIISIKGILNGTSNFILTQMTKESVPFSIALKEAQELGIAEADPSLDVDGIDAACKIVIMANCLLNQKATLSDVKIKGIQDITKDAIELADDDEFVIRQIASAENGKLEVSPRLVLETSIFAIEGTLNLIQLETDLAKEIIIIGRGAGGAEAASALLADILYIHKNYD